MPKGGSSSGRSIPIGDSAKIGMLKTRLTQKRLRMSWTIACMSMPGPWPISWAIAGAEDGIAGAATAAWRWP